MSTPKYKTKKLAIIGVTAGLVAGAGAGLLLNLPGGASAKSPVAVSATDTDGTDAPASSIGGDTADGDHDGDHDGRGPGGRHGMDPAAMEAHVRETLQPLVDANTIDASEVDAIVTTLATPPTDTGTRPEPGTMLATRLQSLVDDGTLTSTQLDAVVAALEAAHGDHGPGMGHGGHRGGMRAEMLTTAADAIGITADELKAEIEAGKTIADVAVENGKTAQDVIDALVAAANADMTQRITDMVNGVHPSADDAPAPGA